MRGCLRLEDTRKTGTRRDTAVLLRRLPCSEAPNLGDKIRRGSSTSLCLLPQSSLGGERTEHGRPLCAQKEKELLCLVAFGSSMCHLQRPIERRRAHLVQLFLCGHEDTFCPSFLSQPPRRSHCPGIRSYGPKAAPSQCSETAD